MLSRRTLIGKAAVGAAAAAVGLSAARKGLAAVRPAGNPVDDRGVDGVPPGESSMVSPPPAVEPSAASWPAPWELLRPLTAGAALGRRWRLVDLSAVLHGACVVTLANARGRSRRVHICRNDGTPRGLVYTRRLDLVVMNDGRGDLPTEEGLAQAVARLAHVIAANERAAASAFFAALLPHAERVQRFAGAQLR
jgi:hypothetical protein